MKIDIAVPMQICILRLVGGYVQRAGDPASPVYRGEIATGSGQIMLQIMTEPGSLYDPRGMVEIDGLPACGSGLSAGATVEETTLQPIEGVRDRLDLTVKEQTIALRTAANAKSYRLRALSGTMDLDGAECSVMMLGDDVFIGIGSGAYART